MFLCVSLFYLSPVVAIHVCGCYEVVVLWVPLHVCTMVI